MMPRPIRVSVRWVALAFTSRHRACEDKNKSFGQAFLKACGFQRQSLWSHAAACEILCRWKRLLKGKSAREFSLADWGTFCKRKSSRQTAVLYIPAQPSGGRLGVSESAAPSFCKIKFSPAFFKRLWFPKAKPLVARRSARNTSIVQAPSHAYSLLKN